MKTTIACVLFGVGLVIGSAGASGCAAPTGPEESTEDSSKEADALQLAGGMSDLSSIAFDPQAPESTPGPQTHPMPSFASRYETLALAASADAVPEGTDEDQSRPIAGEETPESAGDGSPETTIGAEAAAALKLIYHGGPVMPRQNVYFIYYGNWANTTRTRSLLHTFVNGLHTANLNQNFLDGLEYAGQGTTHAGSKGFGFGGAVGVGYPYGHSLTDAEIANVVHSVLNSGKLSPDANGLYFVMPSPDVAVHNDTKWCGWHSRQTMNVRFQDNYNVTVDVKYGVIRNTKRGSGCSYYGTAAHHSVTPNRDFVADSQVNVISHEMVEAMTDPDLNAWFDAKGEENSDKCAWNFKGVRSVNASHANLYDRNAKRWWLLQSEFRHNRACGNGAAR